MRYDHSPLAFIYRQINLVLIYARRCSLLDKSENKLRKRKKKTSPFNAISECAKTKKLTNICISLLLIRICQKTINWPPIKGLICLSNAPFAPKLSVQYRLPGTPTWNSIWQCTTIATSSGRSIRSWCGPKGEDGK